MILRSPWLSLAARRIGAAACLIFLSGICAGLTACTHISLSGKGGAGHGAASSFASTVARHLFDSSAKSYESSQKALAQEIAPGVLSQLKQRGLCARSPVEIKARVKDFGKRKQSTTVKIESAEESGCDSRGFIPVTVKGSLLTQSTAGKSASRFDAVFLLGMNVKTKKLVVASIEIK